MLNLTTALGRNGWQDWILQRISAAFLGFYTIFLLVFWFSNPKNDPLPWQLLFSVGWVHFATVVALVAVMVHAWIGIWIVVTDYIKFASLRLLTLVTVYCFLLFNLIWCIQILWEY